MPTGQTFFDGEKERLCFRAALEQIANHEHCQYKQHNDVNRRSYATGVADGHRCAAIIAMEALAHE